jgi:hypothetical protein
MAYVGSAMLGDRFGNEIGYLLRIAATTAALGWAWRWLVPFRGPGSPANSALLGALAGLGGTLLWIGLLLPFVPDPGEAWDGLAFGLRLFSSGIVTPVFEELFLTAFVLRFATQWDRARPRLGMRGALYHTADEDSIATIEPGAWTSLAVAITAVAFASGHAPAEWPAAIAYSLLMSSLWIARGDLVTCMVAHGTTNVALALYVRATGLWQLW